MNGVGAEILATIPAPKQTPAEMFEPTNSSKTPFSRQPDKERATDQQEQAASLSDLQISPDFPKGKPDQTKPLAGELKWEIWVSLRRKGQIQLMSKVGGAFRCRTLTPFLVQL
ncbi:hypothetical protein [Ruegeria sp.]|uniref:hypothetical protein n=1 Tax=Ruegeria sp. TaxID=1879320 RepID=UPI0023201E48|nr:hypothetical protein [Ruegeria sp.]MDA7967043.1 hypothetical protein [Ruegeria sp.]